MSGQRLRVGIAGYGVVGKRRHHFVDRHPSLVTVAVCDQNLGDGSAPAAGVSGYTDYRALLADNLDVLFVCMPNDIAPHVVIAGLEAGLHVFCEKPPGRDLDDMLRVVEVARRRSTQKLKYGFNHRYHDSVQDALRIVRSGELGTILNLRGVYGKSKFVSFGQHSDWRIDRRIAGGGILLDQGIHMVDLMRLFAGDFETIHSFLSNRYWGHDVEDNAYALMRTADGKVAFLHSTATQWRHRFSLEITLERGALNLGGILSGSKSYGAETLTVVRAAADDLGDPAEQRFVYDVDNSWAAEIDEFSGAIINDTPIVNGSANEALRTMHLVYRIYCADAQWRDRWGLSDRLPSNPDYMERVE